jgi:hypothetical protein
MEPIEGPPLMMRSGIRPFLSDLVQYLDRVDVDVDPALKCCTLSFRYQIVCRWKESFVCSLYWILYLFFRDTGKRVHTVYCYLPDSYPSKSFKVVHELPSSKSTQYDSLEALMIGVEKVHRKICSITSFTSLDYKQVSRVLGSDGFFTRSTGTFRYKRHEPRFHKITVTDR